AFEECAEGEIHHGVDFGTQATSTDGGQAPTDIALSNTALAENSAVGTVIGTLTTTDPDAADTFTYTLVAGDATLFEISGNSLVAKASADFETQAQYSLTIRSTDSTGQSVDKAFTIAITNVNEAPTQIALSSAQVDENRPAGTVVGQLSSSDPDAGDSWSYTLVAGDTSSFTLSGSDLQTAATFNHEATASYSVTVRSTDTGGLTFDRTFTITVADVNEAPTAVALSSDSLDENLPAGTVIGSLSTTDPDVGDTFTYTLVAGDVAAVEVVGKELRSKVIYDYETQSSWSVTVRSTDAGGLAFDRVFTIRVLDKGGKPAVLTLPTATVTYVENAVPLLVNSTATVTDPDTAHFGGGSLRVRPTTGWQAIDRLTLRNQGTSAGLVGLSGSNVLWGGVTVGSFTGGTASEPELVISLNSLATPTVVAGLLKNVQFTATGDNPSNTPRTLAFTLYDGVGESAAATLRTVAVTPVNDIPVLATSSGTPLAYTENDPALLVQTAVTVTDLDSPDFLSGRFTAAFTSGQVTTDRLVLLGQGTGTGEISLSGTNVLFEGTVIGTYAGGFTTNAALVVTLNAAATPAGVQALARRVAFLNAGDDPGTTTRVVSFTLSDGDGGTSAALTRQIAVTAVNDAPVLTPSTGATAFTENGVAKAIDAAFGFVDADSVDLAGGVLTVSLSAGGTADDRLSILNGGTAAGKIGLSGDQVLYSGVSLGTVSGGFTSSADLLVTFNAGATRTAVAALMKNLAIQVLGDNPSTAARTVRFFVTDGDGGTSAAVTKTVTVAAVNDAPTLAASAGSASYLENAAPVLIDPAFSIGDVDSANFDLGTLKVGFASGSITTDRIVLVDEGTGAGQVGIASGKISFGGTQVGTFTGGMTTSGLLTITFNAAATPAIAQAVARRMGYSNASDNPGVTT
ncbi:MAG: cadherin domain-containing protein, partial [Planctomycetaceae bacterium]